MSVPTFREVLGQSAAIDTLTRAYAADRLPHGLLFAGPVGVGKALTARALGTLFLCEKPRGTEPCARCESCTLMGAGTHPDFHSVYRQLIRLEKDTAKARDLTIDVVRDYLVAPANLKATMNRGKVFVVEEADLMNAAAQNSMLKTLEEPAGRTLIVLLTDQPNALLQTIRSRCQWIAFAALGREMVQEQLVSRGVDPGTAAEAAELSEGSLGLALRWIEDEVVPAARDLHGQMAQLAEGRPAGGGGGSLEAWFKQAADGYAKRQLDRDPLASKDQATREGLGLYLRLAALYFRRQLTGDHDADRLDRLCSAIESLNRTENHLDANVNIPLAFQQLSIALHRDLGAAR
jgi:DNA polymerase III delta' subunit